MRFSVCSPFLCIIITLLSLDPAAGSTKSKSAVDCQQPQGCIDEVLPPVEHWPHRPVFLSPSVRANATNDDLQPAEPLPLGIPFDLETPIFKGRMLVRLRNCPIHQTRQHEQYFSGRKHKKVLMQIVLQGRFKKPVPMSDVYIGSRFDRPLRLVPPPFIQRALHSLLRRVSPGVHIDLGSDRPTVSALYAGSVQSMSIDVPGMEPDVTGEMLPENVAPILGAAVNSEKRRKMTLSQPQAASAYEFDMDHVYTFHTVDEVMDYARYRMRIPMVGNFDLRKVFGQQPVNLAAETLDGETLFSVRLFHESLYRDM